MSHGKKLKFHSSEESEINDDAFRWCKNRKKTRTSDLVVRKDKSQAVMSIVDSVLNTGDRDQQVLALKEALQNDTLIPISKSVGYVHSEVTSVALYFLHAISKILHRVGEEHVTLRGNQGASNNQYISRTRFNKDR